MNQLVELWNEPFNELWNKEKFTCEITDVNWKSNVSSLSSSFFPLMPAPHNTTFLFCRFNFSNALLSDCDGTIGVLQDKCARAALKEYSKES